MAVQDPNYENFNYQGLLNQAISPLNTLGQGRLALTQEQGNKMFQVAAQQKQFELETQRDALQSAAQARNRIAEIQAQSTATANLNKAEREEALEMQKQSAIATAKQINPSFAARDGETSQETIARAGKVAEDQTVSSIRTAVSERNSANADYLSEIKAAGLPPTIPQSQLDQLVGGRLANDPDFIRSLSATAKQQLADGTISPNQLVQSLVSGRLVGGVEGVLTGFNPNKTAADLAAKAQQYRQSIIDNLHQTNLQALGVKGQMLQNRMAASNEIINKGIGAIPAYRLGEIQQDINEGKSAGGLYDMTQPGKNPDGTFDLTGQHAPDPQKAAANKAAADKAAADKATADAAKDDPRTGLGTQALGSLPPQLANPAFEQAVRSVLPNYTSMAPQNIIPAAIAAHTKTVNSIQANLDRLGASISPSGQAIINPVVEPRLSGPGIFLSPYGAGAAGTSAGAPTQMPSAYLSPKDIQRRQDEANALIGHYHDSSNALRILQSTPIIAPQTAPTGSQALPPFRGAGTPSSPQPLDSPMRSTPIPQFNQPTPPSAPGGVPPQAGNGAQNPFQVQQIQSKINQAFGSSNPDVLAQTKQVAHQMGLDDSAVQRLIQGVLQDDPQSVQFARSLTAKVTGGNGFSLPPMAQPASTA